MGLRHRELYLSGQLCAGIGFRAVLGRGASSLRALRLAGSLLLIAYYSLLVTIQSYYCKLYLLNILIVSAGTHLHASMVDQTDVLSDEAKLQLLLFCMHLDYPSS